MASENEEMINVVPGGITTLTLTVAEIGHDGIGGWVRIRWEEQDAEHTLRPGNRIEMNLYGEGAEP